MNQTFKLVALSAANIGISVLIQWYVISKIGVGIETDALLAGMTIPQLITGVMSGTMLHVLVPIFTCKDSNVNLNAWSLIALVGGFFLGLYILISLSAPWWIPITFPGFEEPVKLLTIELAQIQLIGMVFTVINSIEIAVFHARQKFFLVEITSIGTSVLAFLFLSIAMPSFDVITATWALTLRAPLQTLLMMPIIGKPIWPNLSSSAIHIAWLRIKPLIIGTTYNMTDQLVDRHLLSNTSSGNLSIYILSQQIYGASSEIINKAIANPLILVLSKLHEEKDRNNFKHVYYKNLLKVFSISLLGLFIIWIIGENTLHILIKYSNLTNYNIEMLWVIMILMSGRFAIGNITMVISSLFYSLGDTKTITKISVISYTFGIVIRIILFYIAGINGLALAITIQYTIYLILMLIVVRKKYSL